MHINSYSHSRILNNPKYQNIMSSKLEEELPPHVVIFPFPAQGHMNCMLNLAHLFCLTDFHVTFVVSEFSHRLLLSSTSVPATFAAYPGFQFRSIPDGLPDHHPRSGAKAADVVPAVTNHMVPLFKKMMAEEDFLASPHRRPATCFVADGFFTFAVDFAEENGIPLIYFRTPSASYFWAYFHVDDLIQAQEIPINAEKSMDLLVEGVPGMKGFLRRRDLPGFFRTYDLNEPLLQSLAVATKQIVRAQAVIFNTFDDLEGPIVSLMLEKLPRIFTIGPIHEQQKSKLMEKKSEASAVAANFWAEDRSCIDWLSAQPRRSVIYVSFGSTTVVTREQLMEFWHGLVNSSQRFLWVMRPDSVAGKDGDGRVPAELAEGAKEKGYFVKWVPQEEVLNHPAVGGFLTHSGWNSTLESIVAGVPMICWPYFGDQTINSRFVSEVWKIGVDIKDTCDRLIIEEVIREVMVVRKDEFLERADGMAKMAKKAVERGGSSYRNLDALIEFIKSFIT
ncbi:7-deoxyloganetic acid glucosyl transferase-like isoform X3 [Salvia miltiorrhiza]|uniref:7-deoxyloganetic acid glucosyl transferase-like isoform X3 n=1 Tax=Salvia miltiorrhiza TaxID=226208 RepID=UPI0025AC2A72|nr:7-deoxyloganetic acid glucosyl transferase-like isoform X3 [Salvia miltiorrhiza]